MRKTYYFDIDGLQVSVKNHPLLAGCNRGQRHALMAEKAEDLAREARCRHGKLLRAYDVHWDEHGVRHERVEMEGER